MPEQKRKKGYSVKFSNKSYSNSKIRELMQTKEYTKWMPCQFVAFCAQK